MQTPRITIPTVIASFSLVRIFGMSQGIRARRTVIKTVMISDESNWPSITQVDGLPENFGGLYHRRRAFAKT